MTHRAFSLVLGGGGARGFAHAGVLRALEGAGIRPAAIVGVSMGAVVAAAYSRREDWYEALLAMDLSEFPGPLATDSSDGRGRLVRMRRMVSYLGILRDMARDWGPGGEAAREAGLAEIEKLLGPGDLADGRVPVAVSATDLNRGERVVLSSGSAVRAVYASAALAGVVPPLSLGDHLLADGAYTDLAPVDVARALVDGPVIAVDPGQPSEADTIRNGFQAIMRAMEICHRRHADLRFDESDVVIRPAYRRAIDTLAFDARRECVAAGIRATRRRLPSIDSLLALG